MRLAEFIVDNIEAILTEWQSFARTLLPSATNMTELALRDHAPEILAAVATDITTTQTREQQAEKAKGRAPVLPGAPETAAQTHAVMRARSGFDIVQLVAEYRALRASVLRLWFDSNPIEEPTAQELIRFNEAIDQAIAESVGHFHAQMERSRNLFLGMLGHDMRTPLNAIVATASYLAALKGDDQISEAAERLIRSGASMRALLDDLVDFNRSQLGLGMKITSADVDLAQELADEMEQLRGAHPHGQMEFSVTGNCHGHWDSGRVRQVLRNLVSNAVEYAPADTPVRVELIGEDAEVRLEVANEGPMIDPAVRDRLFEPLTRGDVSTNSGEDQDRLGLGLFIVREIARAHCGSAGVRSDDAKGETIFVVSLPRKERIASD